MDDKAYLKARHTRNQRIFQPTDDSIFRKLPKYDSPVGMVNVTPSTYRIMTKQVKQIDDTQETEILTDACYCFVRPKYFLDSSESVWASEFMRLRYEELHKFDVSNGENSSDSKEFKNICIILTDALNLYLDPTEKSGILSVRKGFDFKEYEKGRLYSLQKSIWQVFDLYSIGQDKMSK